MPAGKTHVTVHDIGDMLALFDANAEKGVKRANAKAIPATIVIFVSVLVFKNWILRGYWAAVLKFLETSFFFRL